MGAIGPTTTMVFVFGPLGSIPGIFVPIIIWSRVRLERHTIAQVIVGAGLGILLTSIQFWPIVQINIGISLEGKKKFDDELSLTCILGS